MEEGERPEFKVLAVIQLNASVVDDDWINWFTKLLSSPSHDGGGDFQVFLVSDVMAVHGKSVRLLCLGLTEEQILLQAERSRVKKLTNDGKHMVTFNRQLLDQFSEGYVVQFEPDDICIPKVVLVAGESPENLFSLAEQGRFALERLRGIRSRKEQVAAVPEHHKPELDLLLGECLISKLEAKNFVDDVFPLHEEKKLRVLQAKWLNFEDLDQPYDEIRDYFGEKLGIYFAFLGFYTRALILPVAVSIFYWILPWDTVTKRLLFCLFNLLWVTIFLEKWKRRSSTLAYSWGTLGSANDEEQPRAEFKGPIGKSPITGRPEPIFPRWNRYQIMLSQTYPIVLACLFASALAMWIYFQIQLLCEKVAPTGWGRTLFVSMPTVIYCIGIAVVNGQYRMLATHLNDQENHRVHSEYECHLIFKLISFYFVNSFGCLFYTAFVIQDMERLNRYLICNLITMQFFQQIQEAFIPYLRFAKRLRKAKASAQLAENENLPFKNQLLLEAKLENYEDTFDDYLELWLQFGHAFLFSSVFPFAAFWALINNVIEIRTDAFKLCTGFRRPFAVPASSIGAWQTAFEVIGMVAVVTNCGLLATSPNLWNWFPNWKPASVMLLFVAVEHMILVAKFALSKCIPDVPESIQHAIQRVEFLSREAYLDKQIDNLSGRNSAKERHVTRSLTFDACEFGKLLSKLDAVSPNESDDYPSQHDKEL